MSPALQGKVNHARSWRSMEHGAAVAFCRQRREAERRRIRRGSPVERILPATIVDRSGLPPLPTRMGQRRLDCRPFFKGRFEEKDIRSEGLSLVAV
jgi:hypothetical protein